MLAGALLTALIRTRQESGIVISTALIAAGISILAVTFLPFKPITRSAWGWRATSPS